MALSVSGALLAVASVSMVRHTTGMRLARVHGGDGNTRRMLSYGLPLAATGLAGTLGYQFDRIVVGVSFFSQEFAVYALGAVEIPLGLLIAAAVSNVLVPRLTILWRDGDRAGMVALWREAMRKTSLVLLPLFAFMMVMSADLVLLLYGPGYSESVDVFRVYLFLLPLRIATWGLIPLAIGRTGINLRPRCSILATNAVVALALVGPLGLIGAALAAPISAVEQPPTISSASDQSRDSTSAISCPSARSSARWRFPCSRRRRCWRSASSLSRRVSGWWAPASSSG